MSRSRPTSPKNISDKRFPNTSMMETQRILPPPDFLDKCETKPSYFRPQLPPLRPYPGDESITAWERPAGALSLHPLPPPSPRPLDTSKHSRTASTSKAIPISALLSEAPDTRPPRIDSVALPTPTHPPRAPPTRYHDTVVTYNTAPHPQPLPSPAHLPQSHFLHSPTATSHGSRAVFEGPWKPGDTRSQHSRNSSLYSPSSSKGSTHGYFHNEPKSAASEVSMAAMAAATLPQAPPEPEREYSLRMRQQPKAARACGFGERDRRVVDPPPIIELVAHDVGTGEQAYESDSYTTLHCVLINAETGEDESQIPAARPDMVSAQRLMGNTVASPCVANDDKGEKGSFFVFPDLSCRSPGRYKLLFRLLKVNPQAINSQRGSLRTRIESDAFEVFTAKEFPGMRASSPLLRALRAQGLNVGVKKGSEASRRNAKKKAKLKKKGNEGSEDEGGSGSETGGSDTEGYDSGREHKTSTKEQTVPVVAGPSTSSKGKSKSRKGKEK